MNNIKILDPSLCTGCSLCSNVCPVPAIKMEPNAEGFLHPTVNESCINCGLCAKKCPQLSEKINTENDFTAYAAWAEKGARQSGSSGGIFPLIAEHTIKNNGVVYGAAFDETYRRLHHIGVEDKAELSKLYKSKYVQSDVGDSYKQAKEHLENGRNVVFSGCPCQIDAFKTYLGKDYDNLITIDILCHGTPSPLAYSKFLDEVSGGKKITGVDFRDKTYGWGTLIRVDFDDKTHHYDPHNGAYFRAFLSGISMRDACYHCKYSQEKRVGDITLGDFWGIKSYNSDLDDKNGTSMILCNTEKGKKLINDILPRISKLEEIPYNDTVEISKKANAALVRPTSQHKMHKCFFKHLNNGHSFTASLAYAEKSRMDVGILGWWIETSRSNYGSTLTDYALYQYLGSLGLSVAMISPPNFNRENAGGFNKRAGYRMTQKYSAEDMHKNNDFFDTYVVASDVLWYYRAFIASGWMFLLDFANDNIRKISYSTSFGNTASFFPDEEMLYAKYLMQRFDHVSVREFEGVDICKSRFGVEATQVLDPVFLCDMNDWKTLAERAERKTKDKYVFAYILDPSHEKANELRNLAKKLGYELVTITDKQEQTEEREKILKKCNVISKASIEEFIYHIMNAEFVVTDSFHGFCFSMIFGRQFRAVPNKKRGTSRFDTLSSLLDIKPFLLDEFSDLENISKDDLLNVDYEKLSANIERERERSKKWLDNALFSTRVKKPIATDIVMGKEIYMSRKTIKKLEEKIAALEEKINKIKQI